MELKWGYRYLISREALGLRTPDYIELKHDLEAQALAFNIVVVGDKDDLLYSLDRLIWTLQELRYRAEKEPSLL